MTPKEIDNHVLNCPYFGGKNCIDRKYIDGEPVHIGTCDLEFHHRKICPSFECCCANHLFG